MKKIINHAMFYIMMASSIVIGCPYDKDKIIEITTEEQLQNLLTNSQGPSAISFHMPYCGYCIKMHSMLENIADNDLFDHITFYKVNGQALNAHIHLKNILNEVVTGYPTIFFMNQGKVTSKQIGLTSKENMHKHLHNVTAKKKSYKSHATKSAQNNKSNKAKKATQAAIAKSKMKQKQQVAITA